LDTHRDSRPEQHKDQPEQRKKGILITAIAITIMAIATTNAAAAHIVEAAYGTNNEGEQCKREDTVSRIERANMTKLQVTRKQAFTAHIKQDNKAQQMGEQSWRKTRHGHRTHEKTIMYHRPTDGEEQAGKETLLENGANTNKEDH
jgi:hypothetical protein